MIRIQLDNRFVGSSNLVGGMHDEGGEKDPDEGKDQGGEKIKVGRVRYRVKIYLVPLSIIIEKGAAWSPPTMQGGCMVAPDHAGGLHGRPDN